MGMYDDVIFEMKCPVCNTLVDGFQTKDGGRSLANLKISELPDKGSFYSSCRECGCWIEFNKHHCYNSLERKQNMKKFISENKKVKK